MGADKINSAGSQKNVDNIKNENRLSEEKKAKNEKKSTSEKIQEYYKKHDEHQETLDMMKLDDEQKRLAKKAQDIQKHYSAEQAKGHDFSDIMKTVEGKTLEDIKKLEAELEVEKQQQEAKVKESIQTKSANTGEDMQAKVDEILKKHLEEDKKLMEQMENELAAKKEKIDRQLENQRKGFVLDSQLDAVSDNISKLESDSSRLRAEIAELRESGNTEELAKKEVEYELLRNQIETLKEEQERIETMKRLTEIDKIKDFNGLD